MCGFGIRFQNFGEEIRWEILLTEEKAGTQNPCPFSQTHPSEVQFKRFEHQNLTFGYLDLIGFGWELGVGLSVRGFGRVVGFEVLADGCRDPMKPFGLRHQG